MFLLIDIKKKEDIYESIPEEFHNVFDKIHDDFIIYKKMNWVKMPKQRLIKVLAIIPKVNN